MNLNIKELENELQNSTVPVPLSGTLSGHAAGEPFDKIVYEKIKLKYPGDTYRQYEYLNKILSDNIYIIGNDRMDIIKPRALNLLINRSRNSMISWSLSSQFSEKQDDTADIIVKYHNFINIIDVKTYNIDKKGQAPNIISAYKLAKMCAQMLLEKSFDKFDITYIEIAWEINGGFLECKEVYIKELFKTIPSQLYINWAAAMQIQFHVSDLNQNHKGTVEEWCKEYLRNYVSQARKRAETMITKFVNPFEELVK